MLGRLCIQFGVLVVLGVCAAAPAYADDSSSSHSAPGDSASQSQKSEVTITTAGSVEVSNSTHTSQSTGGAGTTNDGPGSDAGQGGIIPGLASEQSSTLSGLASESDKPSSGTLSATSGLTTGSSDQSSPTSFSSSLAVPATGVRPSSHPNITLAVKNALLQNQAAIQETNLETSTKALIPQPAVPTIPQNPGDILGTLRVLLTSSIIPTPQEVTSYSGAMLSTFAGLSAGLALIVLMVLTASLLLIDFYTARLRRSGYSVAARSDVGAAVFSFVTPQKMGFIGSYAT